ncbi:hypothetical protein [Roseivirga sp. 4D4]|uniref:hypothetical protein n=1 Tax=Roseivirga sp. 4D4 TaxID=1889784 RepID=UPI001112EDD1|nr:hypothetical protein [Roseivirga sp. 4D4]
MSKLSLLVAICVTAYAAFLSLSWNKIRDWSSIPPWVKVVVMTCVLLLLWAYACSEHNYFYDRSFLLDKALFVIIGLAAFFRPQFIPVFLLQAYLLSKQFSFALPSAYTYTDKQIIFDILFGFSVFYFLKTTIAKNVLWSTFTMLVLLIICNWYFKAGLGKILVGWQHHNSLYNLFMASTAYDWLYQFPELKTVLAKTLSHSRGVIEYATLVIEFLFPLILFWKRSWFRIVIGAFIVFHLTVFITSGIFFWKWAVLEFVLMALTWRYADMIQFGEKSYLLSYVSLLIITYLISPTTSLVWYDTPFVQKYTLSLVDDKKLEYNLDPSFFSPYDVIFAQNRFAFLSERPVYTGTYGSTTSLETLKEANLAVEEVRLPAFSTRGDIQYSESKKEDFLFFVQTFVQNKLQNDVKWVSWIDAPMHIHQGANQQNISIEENIVGIKLTYEELLTLPSNSFRTLFKKHQYFFF